ncbi:c-type cytochrome [Salinisphaera orenii]|uniref:Cytochrome C n=1 Tax=Salinisphaera orenii YIM 95161 TaxID=1051139 RepID=A0A423PW66_9GAMM|nr:c-type cytochrome [Salinisphaera halophila]ROO29856.1 cytochrome C [Salinisphaera halophila YIM 95161]
MTADHDKTFFRTFMIVLGLLVAITVLAIIGANIITGMTANDEMRPEQVSRVKERTQPVYAVNTDPDATQMAASGDEGGEPMSGEEVFDKVCTACHTSGAAGAPKVSDTGAWEKRLSEQGKDTLYKRSIEGYKGMPAKGGDPSLSEDEMHKAVDYILSEAGAS